MDGAWVNDPYVIAQNDNQVSINTTIEVDLTGQCASESLGSRPVSYTHLDVYKRQGIIGGTIIYAIAALGLNLLLGYSGLISLGTAGFM